ncbi:MAG TPA: hypothetical protein VGM27_05590 [Acidobacteriaceae bacterium]|jgi:hypothetical protein
MADQLYLSLWFPNFRFDSLPRALLSVLQQFPVAGGSQRVHAAAAYPISWNEAPAYQRIYDQDEVEASMPETAVAEAAASLYDDFAYEFEMTWDLWIAEEAGGLDPIWREEPRIVRVTGFGPHFDEGAYQQNGHIRVDFGIDTPFIEDDVELDSTGVKHVEQNLQRLIVFTRAVEQKCGISSRLLWSESGENLAQKLIARLQRVN